MIVSVSHTIFEKFVILWEMIVLLFFVVVKGAPVPEVRTSMVVKAGRIGHEFQSATVS